jgi:ribosomal-protein-alanine N-acetyltransferase
MSRSRQNWARMNEVKSVDDANPEAGLRAVGALDAEVIAALHGESFEHEPWSTRAVAEILALPGAFGYLAERERQPAGFALALAVADDCEILSIAVRPTSRRRGLGRALLRAALQRARSLGSKTAYLEVAEDDPQAQAFYHREGFCTCGRRSGYYARNADTAVAAMVLCRPLA